MEPKDQTDPNLTDVENLLLSRSFQKRFADKLNEWEKYLITKQPSGYLEPSIPEMCGFASPALVDGLREVFPDIDARVVFGHPEINLREATGFVKPNSVFYHSVPPNKIYTADYDYWVEIKINENRTLIVHPTYGQFDDGHWKFDDNFLISSESPKNWGLIEDDENNETVRNLKRTGGTIPIIQILELYTRSREIEYYKDLIEIVKESKNQI